MTREPLHVLLVEDEPDHAEVIQVLLGEAWSGELSWSRKESLADTLLCLSEQPLAKPGGSEQNSDTELAPIDIVLLDLRLPDSSGLETLRQVLNHSLSIPVIVLTSLNDGELGARAVSEGAQDYVVKSEMSTILLEKTIRYAIQRHRHAAELKYRNRDLLNFAHTVAHEIRNPLNTIKIGTQVLKKSCYEPEAEAMLTIIEKQVKHVSEFVTDMLQFSGGMSSENNDNEADGEACLQAALTGLHDPMKERNVCFNFDPLPALAVKPLHLQHLFQNLVSNAVKYGQTDDPKIHVGASRDEQEGFWRIFIFDNGLGIPQQDHEKVFSMFTRAGPHPEESGLGIGLAYCRRVVESYGGRIWVDSEPGRGSTFYFTLPAVGATDNE